MKKKVILIIFLVIILGIVGYLVVINTVFNEDVETIDEYTPEVEISDEELRNTIVTLYFVNSETGSIASEARLIDSKELLRDPYTSLINMLIEGPKDSSLSTIVPTNTKVLSASLNESCVTVDLSEEFINNAPEDGTRKK